MSEWNVEHNARSNHFDIRSDDRLPAANRCPHRFPEHRMVQRSPDFFDIDFECDDSVGELVEQIV